MRETHSAISSPGGAAGPAAGGGVSPSPLPAVRNGKTRPVADGTMFCLWPHPWHRDTRVPIASGPVRVGLVIISRGTGNMNAGPVFRAAYARALREALQPIAPVLQTIDTPAPLRIRRLIAEVAARHGFWADDILGPSKTAPVVEARFAAIRAAFEASPGVSSPRLASWFCRDHTAILNALGRLSLKNKRRRAA